MKNEYPEESAKGFQCLRKIAVVIAFALIASLAAMLWGRIGCTDVRIGESLWLARCE